LFGHVFCAVALDNVPDFVPEDSGELAFGLKSSEECAGDKDLSAGESKGVDGFGIGEEVEFELVRGFFGDGVVDKMVANGSDGFGFGAAFDDASVLGGHFWGRLESEGDFLIWGEAYSLFFAGDRVGLARSAVSEEGHDSHHESDHESGFASALWFGTLSISRSAHAL
jgi:hypothetical protein